MAGSTLFERHTFRIILGKPGVGSILTCKDLEVSGVADLFYCADIDPHGHGFA
jgi:hypothetical protein